MQINMQWGWGRFLQFFQPRKHQKLKHLPNIQVPHLQLVDSLCKLCPYSLALCEFYLQFLKLSIASLPFMFRVTFGLQKDLHLIGKLCTFTLQSLLCLLKVHFHLNETGREALHLTTCAVSQVLISLASSSCQFQSQAFNMSPTCWVAELEK